MSKAEKITQFKRIVSTSNTCDLETHIEGVRAFYLDAPASKQNCLYETCIVILTSGHKIGHSHGEEFRYDENNFLVMGAPNPLLCESFASKENPVMGLAIKIDKHLLQQISSQLTFEHKGQASKLPQDSVVQTAEISKDMRCSIQRLLDVLESEEKSRIFGQDILKEIYYHVLKNKNIHALDSLINHNSQYTRIMSVLEHINGNTEKTIHIDDLASMAGMSVPTFHRVFKRMTDESPLQFIKKVRLSKAKDLIENHGIKVNQASLQVGYESTSQFSREFKRTYGIPPSELSKAAS